MTIPIPQFSFAAGELAPSMFGRVDLAKYRVGASTMRNIFVSYRGGANSRAGTALVGQSKQPYGDGSTPPRLIKFQYNLYQGYALEFGNFYLRIIYRGAYIVDLTPSITNITQANPAVVTAPAHGFSNGDWVQITGVLGMLQVNSNTYIVAGATTNTFQLNDLNGNPINSNPFLAYTSGGTASRIYTVASPYAASDLPYLKFTQSADVMSLTHPSYVPYDLARISNTNWTITATTFGAIISPPSAVNAVATTTTGSNPTSYAYVVTAIDANGNESVASSVANITNSVDIAATAGSSDITWSAVGGAQYYYVYKAPPAYNTGAVVPAGVLFGYMAQSYGTEFIDNNITADFTQVPPLAKNPFATSPITNLASTGGGLGYTTATATVTSATGTGFLASPVFLGGVIVSWIIESGGQNYSLSDTVTVTGDGSGATAAITAIGPSTGTYPSVVAYFQERRVYANTNNNPDTYYFSQPGNFTNFDSRVPPIDSDAVTGTPWAQQVSGIQFMVPMPGGLVVLTGLGAWQLTGAGGSSLNPQPITPANQQAQPQAYNGCHDHVPPLTINYDILYVQAKGSIVRDLSYNFFVNIYTGTDLTVLSSHLFTGYQIQEWGWAEEPYKIVWATRSDGTLLSLTYLKEQEISAWTHHDTNGLFQSVCTVTEPPADAPYFVVQRFIGGQWNYYVERMDNRIWNDVEDCWCVDCGTSLPQDAPQATLNASSATGSQNVTQYLIASGGTGYTAPVGEVIDEGGTGTGATVLLSVTGGVITGAVPIATGSRYTGPCTLQITDATGSGAVIQPVITNIVTFTASSSVFTSGSVGSVIRSGGGKATITNYISPTQVQANITQPITATTPNDPNNTPLPQSNGTYLNVPQTQWTVTAPVSVIYGLSYLNGTEVQILADGAVLPPQTVVNGTITLPTPASQVTVGLGFVAQLQLLPLEVPGAATVQTKRKSIFSVGIRVENSRGIQVGSNQIDSSTTVNQQPQVWNDMIEIKERNNSINAGSEIPLFTGDIFQHVDSEFRTQGQVALQQLNCLPMNVLLTIADVTLGDEPGP